MQNIRKYLLKYKYTIKENIFRYNYIIEKISLLPFKKNIEKTIYNDINKICNEDRFYKEFKEYFKRTWCSYFKNKTLALRNINIKFRTNNSLENFNSYFKNNIKTKPNMNLITFVEI